jgi:guanine deaminase
VLAHCIYLDQKELALIAKKGAGIAHCPNSNITIQSGIMPTREYLDYSKGYLKIGLGTDVSGGYSLSILDSIKQCIGLSKVAPSNPVTLPEAFWLATRGGAEVLGLQDSVGCFEEGMQFDALLVDYSP